MKLYKYIELKGFSKLFTDFSECKNSALNRFPNNNGLGIDYSLFEKISSKFYNRDIIQQTIEISMKNIELNNIQKQNLESIKSSNTYFVTTGQQVGFLAGPLYTILKALSAIKIAEHLKNNYPDKHFVPLFWIEDNDHDAKEAAKVSIFDSSYKPIECCPLSDQSDRTIVSELIYNNEINGIINDLIEVLPSSEHKEKIAELLRSVYQESKSWINCFLQLLNHFMSDFGLLFVSASELRKSGIWKNLIIKEISNPGYSKKLVENADIELTNSSYNSQAKASDINLFYHIDNERHSIFVDNDNFRILDETFSKEKLLEISNNYPDRFSAKVLLRPVFQDYALPNVVYTGGPGEIAYLAQTRELYDFFEIVMPALMPRISATFIDKKTSKFIDKNNLDILGLLRPFSEIEKVLIEENRDMEIEAVFENSKTQIKNIYELLKKTAEQAEASLSRTSDGNLHKTLEMIDNLHKKTDSAMKKKNSDLFDKYRQANSLLYPTNKYQERCYSMINFVNQLGISGFKSLLSKISYNTSHQIIDLSSDFIESES